MSIRPVSRLIQAKPTIEGVPLEEPVAWYGPIVMNTQQELRQAFRELREGTFLDPPAR
jgi:hypothetical protein